MLKEAGLQRGDRCALLAPNSSRWVAVDLAIMAEGGIVVPLYARQAPAELATMMKDCAPKLLVCADEELKQSILSVWPDAPKTLLYREIFSSSSRKQVRCRKPCAALSRFTCRHHLYLGHLGRRQGRGSECRQSQLYGPTHHGPA